MDELVSAAGLTVATVRVRVPSGALRTFDASSVSIEDGLATCVGYWRHDRTGGRRRYTWPRRQLVEIGWTQEAARAA